MLVIFGLQIFFLKQSVFFFCCRHRVYRLRNLDISCGIVLLAAETAAILSACTQRIKTTLTIWNSLERDFISEMRWNGWMEKMKWRMRWMKWRMRWSKKEREIFLFYFFWKIWSVRWPWFSPHIFCIRLPIKDWFSGLYTYSFFSSLKEPKIRLMEEKDSSPPTLLQNLLGTT